MITVVALHGFLGQGRDWDAVRAASKTETNWICPDLFGRGRSHFAPPSIHVPCWLAGYSFGARLALRWMQMEPDRWLGALLLSANPGNFQTDEDRRARREADAVWARAFREESWGQLLRRWNAQTVLSGRATPLRHEADFDREKLAAALESYSVADQFTEADRLSGSLTWLAGAQDQKFVGLLSTMRQSGFLGSFCVIPNAGHRLLHDAPEAVAEIWDSRRA